MKIVNWRFYDVRGDNLFKPKANDKSSFKSISCEKYDTCDAYKENKCLGFEGCPYGKLLIEQGYTRRATKSYNWTNEKREIIKNLVPQGKLEKLKVIFDYVYFPYSYWNFNSSEEIIKKYAVGFFDSNKSFIKKEDFYNLEFLFKVLTRNPSSIMGGIIEDYQKKEVPKILQHLKEEINDLYIQLIEKYPSFKIKEEEQYFIGRKAQINTLNINVEFNYDKFKAFFDGKQLVIRNYPITLLFLKDIKISKENKKTIEFKIDICDNDNIIITNNEQVNKNTVFID